MRFIGSMKFYSKIVHKLHVEMKPLFNSLHDNFKLHWNTEFESVFRQIILVLQKMLP